MVFLCNHINCSHSSNAFNHHSKHERDHKEICDGICSACLFWNHGTELGFRTPKKTKKEEFESFYKTKFPLLLTIFKIDETKENLANDKIQSGLYSVIFEFEFKF